MKRRRRLKKVTTARRRRVGKSLRAMTDRMRQPVPKNLRKHLNIKILRKKASSTMMMKHEKVLKQKIL